MSKKIKAVIAIGGTGGHVIPGYNLALHLKENNFIVDLVTDTRGLKYLKSTKNFKTYTFPSSPLIKKNIFATLFSFFVILKIDNNSIIQPKIQSFIFIILFISGTEIKNTMLMNDKDPEIIEYEAKLEKLGNK